MDFGTLVWDDTAQKWTVGVLSAFGTWLLGKWRSKTATLIYTASVERVGLTTEDPIFGSVEVRWQQLPLLNLYFATLRVSNPTLRDIEALKIVVYPSVGARLLNQRTQIDGTVHIIQFDPKWESELNVKEGEQPTDQQRMRWNTSREYHLDVFNRGEELTFTYLLTHDQGAEPMVFLEGRKAGVRIVRRPHLTTSFGVPTRIALNSGLLLTALVVVLMAVSDVSAWLVALVPAIVGLGALWFGSAAYRGWLYVKRAFAG